MTRPIKKRRIKEPPLFQLFKPAGIPTRVLQRTTLTVDEFEALRLADYENLGHEQGALKMRVSRPTFTRLIDKARKKIAEAIIKGKEIYIEGGSVNLMGNIFQCFDCSNLIHVQFNDIYPNKCPECGSTHLINLAQRCGIGRQKGRRRRWGGFQKRKDKFIK